MKERDWDQTRQRALLIANIRGRSKPVARAPPKARNVKMDEARYWILHWVRVVLWPLPVRSLFKAANAICRRRRKA